MKAFFNRIKNAVTYATVVYVIPTVAKAGTLQSDETKAQGDITTLIQYLVGLLFIIAGFTLGVKFYKMHNAEDDQDYKHAKKGIKWSIFGLIGFAIAEAVVTYIKTELS